MRTLLSDLRFAARVLWKKPGFTAVIALTLALGIGAGSAMFSVIHSLIMRPVDLPDLDRLAAIQESDTRGEFDDELAPRSFLDYRAESRSFAELCAYQWWQVALTGDGDPEHVQAFQVSPGWFPMLRVPPLLGRWFADDEVDGKNDKVAVLTHRLWQRRFGGDRGVVGRGIVLNGVTYTVVGVMPPDHAFPSGVEVFTPLTLTAQQRADRGSRFLGVVGRLAPGVSLEQAHAEQLEIGRRWAQTYPDAYAGRQVRVVSLTRSLTEDFTIDFIYLLFGAALFVLLIACANVANIFLAHAVARRRELAVRAALGAGRGRIVRQLVTEAALLGLCGGVASLILALWGIELIKGAMPADIVNYIPGWNQMGLNVPVLIFALAVGVGVGVLFGVVPAIHASRTDVNAVLKEGERGAGSAHSHRLRSVLVVSQVALALVLLLGAGALARGFQQLATARTALATEEILTLRVNLPEARYPEDHHILELERSVVARLTALPGVRGAGATLTIPWGQNNWSSDPTIEGRVERPEERSSVFYRTATAGFFELLRFPLLEGRTFGPEDGAGGSPVAVVSESTARRYWGDTSPIGKRLSLGGNPPEWLTVVGVVADVERLVGDQGPRPTVYVPFEQSPKRSMYFVVRAAGDPLAQARAAQAAVHAVDPLLPVFGVKSLMVARNERYAGIRIAGHMMGIFALLALVLAVIGIYGVIANLVNQRTHEIGVRMALGAQRGDVMRLVLRKGLVLTIIGLVIGLGLGAATVRAVAGFLAGIFEGELALFIALPPAVALLALLGCWLPARRATRVDPMIALRSE